MNVPDSIEADLDHILSVSAIFRSVARRVCEVDTEQVSTGAADGFPGGAAIVHALTPVRSAVQRAFAILADRAYSTCDTMDRVCEDYRNTDDFFAAELNRAIPT